MILKIHRHPLSIQQRQQKPLFYLVSRGPVILPLPAISDWPVKSGMKNFTRFSKV
jgi:hypothetical protein